MCSSMRMPKAQEKPMVRARVDLRRKRNAERILEKIGVTPSQAINMLYAQIEMKHGLPFPVTVEDNSDILQSPKAISNTWSSLDSTDYSYLSQ
jgi:DNA-damage-inducible protein J